MEVCYIRLPRYACDDDDASRLITKNLVSLLDDGRLVGNIKDTSFCVTDLTKFLPLILTFMQIEYLIFLSVERCSRRELREIADYDMTRYAYPKRAGRIAAVERDAAVLPGTWNFREATDGGKSLTSSRSEEVAGKSDVFYKDTKVTSKAIWEALQGLGCCCCETEYLAERDGWWRDYLEHRDSDHREWSGDFQEDETDYQERDDVEKGGEKTLAHCEDPLSSGESDREDQGAANTTDPLLAHELLVPYSRMPRPRLFRVSGEDGEYITTKLPRRPRSPIRHILPGRFDLRSRMEGLLKRRSVAKAHRYLWKSKVRIVQSIKQVSDSDVDRDSIICMLVLQALCEQVTLTTAGINTGTDVRTFVNMAIIWALVDLQILDPNSLDERERVIFDKSELFSASAHAESYEMVDTVGTSKLRRALFEVHRPEFDVSTQLHHRSPWTPVNPAYHRDIVKFYPNVRERINERLPDEYARLTTYVPDLMCYHIKEVSGEFYVACDKKSKILFESSKTDGELDKPFVFSVSCERKRTKISLKKEWTLQQRLKL